MKNKKKNPYSLGGSLLQTGVSLIPGASAFAPIIGMLDQMIAQPKEQQQVNPMKLNTNIYGKMAFGGPLLPPITPMSQESTTVKPFALPIPQVTVPFGVQLPGTQPYIPITKMPGYDPTSSGSSKSKSKVNFYERAKGGLVGNALNTNNFKQFNVGSHASGNDLSIDSNGNGSANTSATVQNKENAYTNLGKTYIYSDTLRNPETGNKFNIDASLLNKKFNKADTQTEHKNALDFSMDRLSKANDRVRVRKEGIQKALGGYVNPLLNQYKVDENVNPLETFNENLPYDLNNPFAKAIPTFTNIPQDLATDNTQVVNAPSLSLNSEATPRTTPSLPSAVTKTETGGSGFNANSLALILKGAGLAKSAADAFTPAEVERPILTDYSKADKQIYGTNVDYTQSRQDAMGASNLASNVNRSASSNFGQYQGRQANNFANLGDTFANIGMKENMDRNQIAQSRGQYEAGKANDNANQMRQTRVNNQMNQANADYADEKLFSEFTDIGDSLNKFEETKKQIADNKQVQQSYANQAIALINSKYNNFQLPEDLVERLKKGSYSIDDIVKVKMQVDSKK